MQDAASQVLLALAAVDKARAQQGTAKPTPTSSPTNGKPGTTSSMARMICQSDVEGRGGSDSLSAGLGAGLGTGGGGSDPTRNGSIREPELPPRLPPAPHPTAEPATQPAPLPSSVMRRRRDGKPSTEQAPTPRPVPVPYGTQPSVHPDTGEPMPSAVKGGRNVALWSSMPAIARRELPVPGGDHCQLWRARALAARLTQYAKAVS